VAAGHCTRLKLDPEIVVSAAWLHDVGYAASLNDTGFHPIDGARFLRTSGWPDDICGLVAYHSCAQIEAGRRGLSSALLEFREVASLERDVLWVSDSTTGPGGERTTLSERVEEVVVRYGRDHIVAQCMLVIAPSLQQAEARVEIAHSIRESLGDAD